MFNTRKALLIATDAYADATFGQLHSPSYDAKELAVVLGDPKIGDYRVETLLNRASYEVKRHIDELFENASVDDLILLYFSGHGFKDADGRLQLATTDTRRSLSASTAVSAQFIRERIDSSRSRKVVVWLDCCYSGAFPAGMVPKAPGDVDVLAQLHPESGRGCVVMTASTHIQYAFAPNGIGSQPSAFTGAIVEGLRTGDADRDGDGWIDTDELYDYVYESVKARTPGQTPTHNGQRTGKILIAHARQGHLLDARPALPMPTVSSASPPPAVQLVQQLIQAPRPTIAYPAPLPRGSGHYRPLSFRPAFWWWMAVTASSSLVPLVIAAMNPAGLRERARAALQANHRPFTEQDVVSAADFAMIFTVVVAVVGGGLFLVLTYRLRAGGKLARNILIVLGAAIIILDVVGVGSVSGWELVLSVGQMMLILVAVFHSFPRRTYA